MGAKNPTKLKLRRPTYKCEECDKKFLSAQALKTHKFCLHKMREKPKPKSKLVNLLGKSVKRTPVKAIDVEKAPQVSEVRDEAPQVSDVRKIEYECPQCVSRFSVYFSAYRHIQKYHCVSRKGKNIPPNAAELMKPIQVERCIKCNMQIRSAKPHTCPTMSNQTQLISQNCACLGCRQSFPSMMLFDLHVQGLHSDGVETLFFPNIHTFTQWREEMEYQTEVKYLILRKCNFKQTYRCSYAAEHADAAGEGFCPSSIVVTEYSKSIQVHFYKNHYGHSCAYKLPDKFKKFLSTVMMKKPYTEGSEEEDLYNNFKCIIDNVITTAADTDYTTLKLLYEKALEMEKILKVEEPKQTIKNMTDKQITETLESFVDSKKVDPLEGKRVKKEVSFVLEDSIEAKKVKKDEAGDDGKKTKTVKDLKEAEDTDETVVASFNDSYKVFVDKMTEQQKTSFLLDKERMSAFKNARSRKKIKTKIGQFRPNILSPRKEVPDKIEEIIKEEKNESITYNNLCYNTDFIKAKVEIDYEVIEQEDDCNILILKI